MDHAFDLPDSTDWLQSSLPDVAPLESALRCQICKDFFDNPVITSCSHTFCSLCIRRCLSAEGKCPACRSPDQESKLRRNWAVQEIVESFQKARPDVLALARQAQTQNATATAEEEGDGEDLLQPAAKKRRLNGPEEPAAPAQAETRRTRSQRRQLEPQPMPAVFDAVDDIKDDDYVPDDGLVPCPMCNRRMKEQAVFNHLDICKGPTEERPIQPRTTFLRPPAQQPFQSLRARNANPSQNPTKPPERLPTLNYSLFKETVLRKKLKDLGIPDWGPRTLLQRRHTEWMNIWNANCDAKIPKTKDELRRDLDVWERSQGGLAPQQYAVGSNAVMAKDFDAAAWSSNHDGDFKWLIENARKKKDKKTENQNTEDAQSVVVEDNTDHRQDRSSSVNGETRVVLAERLPPTVEAPTQVGEIPGNAHVLNGPYHPIVPNGGDATGRVEEDSGGYPTT